MKEAIVKGSMERFNIAFAASPNKNPEMLGTTALHLTALLGRLDMCLLILEQVPAAKLATLTDSNGYHPLVSAVRGEGNCLLRWRRHWWGCEICLPIPPSVSPEAQAARPRWNECFMAIFQKMPAQADKNPMDSFGMTTLHLAAAPGNDEVCKAIVDQVEGVDLGQRTGMNA